MQLDQSSPDAVFSMLREGTIDAFGEPTASHGHYAWCRGIRILPDDLYGGEQTVIVTGGRRDAQDAANKFIDDVRKSGFLRKSIERSGVIGISVAPVEPRTERRAENHVDRFPRRCHASAGSILSNGVINRMKRTTSLASVLTVICLFQAITYTRPPAKAWLH